MHCSDRLSVNYLLAQTQSLFCLFSCSVYLCEVHSNKSKPKLPICHPAQPLPATSLLCTAMFKPFHSLPVQTTTNTSLDLRMFLKQVRWFYGDAKKSGINKSNTQVWLRNSAPHLLSYDPHLRPMVTANWLRRLARFQPTYIPSLALYYLFC
jgi:hypothetical protein